MEAIVWLKIALALMGVGWTLSLITHPKHNETYFYITIRPIIRDTIYIKKDTTMPGFAIESLMGPLAGAIGAGAEYFGAQQQYDYQRKLMQEQELAGQRMGRFNQQLALEMWEKTNYPAQLEQMRKAGLNPGLMYKGAGPGGSTNIAPGAMPSTSGAPRANYGMAVQLALQAQMQQAQIENIKADTKTKEAQVPKIQSEIDLNNAMTTSEQLNADLRRTKYESDQIALRVQRGSEQEALAQIKANSAEAISKARLAKNQAQIADDTLPKVEAAIYANTTLKYLEIQAARLDLVAKGMAPEQIRAQIDAAQNGIVNSWKDLEIRHGQLSVDQHRAITQRIMAELETKMVGFKTSTPEQIKQWTEIVSQAVAFTAGLMIK